jgi:hypothetical protein
MIDQYDIVAGTISIRIAGQVRRIGMFRLLDDMILKEKLLYQTMIGEDHGKKQG